MKNFSLPKIHFFLNFYKKKNINKLLPMIKCGPKDRTTCKLNQICSPHTKRCIAKDNFDRQEKKRIKDTEDDSGAEIPEFPQIRCGVKDNLICKPKQICNPNTKRCIDQNKYKKKYESQGKRPAVDDDESDDGNDRPAVDDEMDEWIINDDDESDDGNDAFEIYKTHQEAVSKLLNLIVKDNIFGDANLNVKFFTRYTRENERQNVFKNASILLELFEKIRKENNSQLLLMIQTIYVICNEDLVTFYDVLMIGVNLSGFGSFTKENKKSTNFILKMIAAMVIHKNPTPEEFYKTFNDNVFEKVNEELEKKLIQNVSNKKVEEPEDTDYFTEALKIITNWPIDGLDYLNGEFLLSFTRAGFDESVKFIDFVGKKNKLREFQHSLKDLLELDSQKGLNSPYILQNIFKSMQKHSVFAFSTGRYEKREEQRDRPDLAPNWRTLLNKLKEKNPRLRNKYLRELNNFLDEMYNIEVPIVYDNSSGAYIMESFEKNFLKESRIDININEEVKPTEHPPRRRIVPTPILNTDVPPPLSRNSF